MTIDLIAKLKTTKEFLQTYNIGDEKQLYDGKSLIFFSLSNTDLKSRYEISNILLNNNVDILCKNKEQETVLHVLLGQVKHDILKTSKLCKRFIEEGVDINAKDKNGQMAIHYIIRLNKTDEELCKLYDLWFSKSDVDLVSKDSTGCSPLEYAEKFPYRCELVERMKKYGER